MKLIESRVLQIGNFRNLGPFYAGKNEDLAKLKLNHSLNRDELGGIIALVGANNTGKSNLLMALIKVKGGIDDNDYTDFTYEARVKPTLRFVVARDRYGLDQWKDQPEIMHSGPFLSVYNQILKQKESYLLFKSLTASKISVEDYIAKVDEFISQFQRASEDNLSVTPWVDEFISQSQEAGPIANLEIFSKILVNRKDIRGWDTTRIVEHIAHNPQRFINDYINGIYSRGKALESCTPEDILEDYQSFEETYGYTLSNAVLNYTQSKITSGDLRCSWKSPNNFFISLLKIIGIDQSAIQNAYAGAGNLRNKLEKDINKSLIGVADELNQILNINQKKYDFSVRLERDAMEFTISYGDDVPLNIDRQSEGFKWLFNFYFNLVKAHDFLPGDILVIDEFGSMLSFGTTRELVGSLRSYAKKIGLTIILATHNPMVVDIMRLDEVRLMVPRDDGSSLILNQFDQFGQENHDVLEPILDGLTVNRNFMRTENRRTVFVEGATDYFYFNAMSRVLRSHGENIDIDFVPINGLGDSSAKPEETINKLKSLEREVIILTDGDKAGTKFAKVAETIAGVKCFTISELFDNSKKEVEDLFSKSDREKYGVDEKSFDRAATFSQQMEEIYPDLEDETKGNFRKIIDYIVRG